MSKTNESEMSKKTYQEQLNRIEMQTSELAEKVTSFKGGMAQTSSKLNHTGDMILNKKDLDKILTKNDLAEFEKKATDILLRMHQRIEKSLDKNFEHKRKMIEDQVQLLNKKVVELKEVFDTNMDWFIKRIDGFENMVKSNFEKSDKDWQELIKFIEDNLQKDLD